MGVGDEGEKGKKKKKAERRKFAQDSTRCLKEWSIHQMEPMQPESPGSLPVETRTHAQ